MKSWIKFVSRHFSYKFINAARAGRIVPVACSHRGLRNGGPHFKAMGCMFSISPTGKIRTVKVGDRWYSPAEYETDEEIGDSRAEEAKEIVGI